MITGEIVLKTAEETTRAGYVVGQALAEALKVKQLSLPLLVTLSGDLGAGKTTFSQGLGQAMGVADPGEVVSPTFTLANEYYGCCEIYHLDIYRLENENQFFEAGLDEYLTRPGLTLVEWPEKLPSSFWPAERIEIRILFQGSGRVLTISQTLPHKLNLLNTQT